MNYLWNLFKRLDEAHERRERERREAFLAESTDIYELEHRIRELEHADRRAPGLTGTTTAS